MNRKKFVVIILVLFSLFGAAENGLTQEVLTPSDFAKDVKFLKRSKNLSVAGYRVLLTVEDGTYAEGRGGSGARADLAVQLKGVDEGLLQEIANMAYQDLMKKLNAAKKTIVSFEKVKGAPGFENLKKEEQPFFSKLGGRLVVIMSPQELPLWFSHFDAPFGNVGAMNLKPWRSLNAVSASTKAVLIVPQISIHFANLETSGRRSFSSTAKVGAKPNLRIAKGESGVKIYFAKIKLAGDLGFGSTKKDIVLDSTLGEMMTVDEQSNADSIDPTGFFRERAEVAITGAYQVDPERFKEEILKGIAQFNDALIGVINKY